ncbi:hypothetical protein GDO78_014664 [Eleutherodactylus coqui]|uniref:Uncharacterized protein n=1 Tax=Eleutherodactylus coqui TaxID=57060 RepID=A0A8J6JPX0_ELECQ|nr:hypothetical protein GDO78_014664 [Eleutherodactylus coqui]
MLPLLVYKCWISQGKLTVDEGPCARHCGGPSYCHIMFGLLKGLVKGCHNRTFLHEACEKYTRAGKCRCRMEEDGVRGHGRQRSPTLDCLAQCNIRLHPLTPLLYTFILPS